MQTETLTFETAHGRSSAFVALPDAGNGKAVLIIQEWWGLNDHIKDIAGRYSAEGFSAIALLGRLEDCNWQRLRQRKACDRRTFLQIIF